MSNETSIHQRLTLMTFWELVNLKLKELQVEQGRYGDVRPLWAAGLSIDETVARIAKRA